MNFGVIGCGTVAQIMYMPYIAELPEATLFALVDPATDRAETLADRYAVDHVLETTEEMLAAVGNDLDAAII
jgi:predicted dehydrogenase